MKHLPTIAGILLGLIFLAAAGQFFFGKAQDQPALPPDTAMAMFMGALGTTGYMKFIKVCELVGGILVMIPKTRNIGLLILGSVIVNIVAFWVFIAKSLPAPAMGLITTGLAVVLSLYLLIAARKSFAGLLN